MTLIRSKMAEAASAVLAAVRRGPAVDPLVGVQIPELLEAAAALRARVRTLSGVHPLVSFESRQHREAFTALRTGKWALSTAVDQPVAFQTGCVAESLPALRTHKRFLSGVNALVLPKVAEIVKMAATVPTFIPTLNFNLLFQRSTHADTRTWSRAVLAISSHRISPICHGESSRRGALQGLEGSGFIRVGVYQFDVFFQEHGAGTEGSTQRADVGVAGKRLP